MESLKYYLPSFIVNEVINFNIDKNNIDNNSKSTNYSKTDVGVIGEKREFYKNIDGTEFGKKNVVKLMYIKEKKIGKIFGYGGLIIKNIRKKTNTSVKISDNINGVRTITITGKKENVENCIKSLNDKLM